MSFQYSTKGDSRPDGKPKIYFTCHPEDFNRYFEMIKDSIFKTHDCVLFYFENNSCNSNVISSDDSVDLERMNLFVIPVTFRLLTEPNRAIDLDLKFAKEKHIPVLPVMMETGIDELYSASDRFGTMQYITPFGQDSSEISYASKLEQYLDSVLVDDQLAETIRKAFNAYIFLSYRKKDRRLANKLMRLIHSSPDLHDIAIWFDEFLIPGESFVDNIDMMIRKSEFFALLVTPSILELPFGKPNYVMETEYPSAKAYGKCILPVEMAKTDKEGLYSAYPGLPECIDPDDNAIIQQTLKDMLQRKNFSEGKSAEHNYLIGLAYLDGIDVERNAQRAFELINAAAQSELPEAISKLSSMYKYGDGVSRDWKKACYWAEKLVERCVELYGLEHLKTIAAITALASSQCDLGNYEEALHTMQEAHDISSRTLGEENQDTLSAFSNLAYLHSQLGEFQEALRINERVYRARCRVLGEDHPDTLTSLNNLATAHFRLGHYSEALSLVEQVYNSNCMFFGHEDLNTLIAINNMAVIYSELGKFDMAVQLSEKGYEARCRVLDEDHPDTLTSLNNLATAHFRLGHYSEALSLIEDVYETRCRVLGEDHPDTLTSLNIMAAICCNLEDFPKALEYSKIAYEARCRVLGENHPSTLSSLHNLACAYDEGGNLQEALRLYLKLVDSKKCHFGENHPSTLLSRNDLAIVYGKLGENEEALNTFNEVYDVRCHVLGEDHPDTLHTLSNLAAIYCELGEYKIASRLNEKAYEARCRMLGENHPDTLFSLCNVAASYCRLEEYKKALDTYERIRGQLTKLPSEDIFLIEHINEMIRSIRTKV